MFFKFEKLPKLSEVIWSAVSLTVAVAAVAVMLADDIDNETDIETLSNHNLLDFFSEMGDEDLFALEIGGSKVGL